MGLWGKKKLEPGAVRLARVKTAWGSAAIRLRAMPMVRVRVRR